MPRARTTSGEDVLKTTLPNTLPAVFQQVQVSAVSHRKNVVVLKKLQDSCADITEDIPGRGTKLTGEKAFNDCFIDALNRVLSIKKGVGNADRVIKFVASFVVFSTEKGP